MQREADERDVEDEWVKGEFSCKFDQEMGNRRYLSSEPIIVEGIIYRLLLFPKGHKEAEGTHISVGLHWNFVRDFAIDPPSSLHARCTMLHSSGDRAGDFTIDREIDDMVDERGARSFGEECKFYLQE